MGFDIKGKIALITGGLSGLGLQYAKELLRNGAKGVTLADINIAEGEIVMKQIEQEFGNGKCIFVKANVTNLQEFEGAFIETVETFKNVDILINSAGFLNEQKWQKTIEINLLGTVNGIMLAMDNYFPKYKQGNDALIVNISSVAGTLSCYPLPVYASTKLAINGLTKYFGNPVYYDATKVKMISICPGKTETTFMDSYVEYINDHCKLVKKRSEYQFLVQSPEFVATEAMEIIKYAPNGTAWIINNGESAYEFDFLSKPTMRSESNILKK